MFVVPEVTTNGLLPLYRPEAGRPVHQMILTDDPVFCCLHWLGRTMPCAKRPDESFCPACDASVALKHCVYVPVVNRGGVVNLMELGLSAGEQLRKIEKSGRLFGCVIEVTRTKAKGAAAVKLVERRSELTKRPCVPDFNIVKTLAWLWALPLPWENETRDAWCGRVRPHVIKKLEQSLFNRAASEYGQQ